MLGTKIKSGAVKNIENIILLNERDSKVSYSAFRGVRNKALVWAVLDRQCYIPNDPIKPTYFRKNSASAPSNPNHKTVEMEIRRLGVNSLTDVIRAKLLAGERIVPDDWKSRRYVINVVNNIMGEGYEITKVSHKKTMRVHFYQLTSIMENER